MMDDLFTYQTFLLFIFACWRCSNPLNHRVWTSRPVTPFLFSSFVGFKRFDIPYITTTTKSIFISGYWAEALLTDIPFFFG